jgi:pimeloyl-ACP methyl ester carboxylesterase
VIVGHSWSGTVAPALALDHPDVTGAVVVLSGVTFVWPGGYSGWYDRLTASWAARLAARTVAVPIGLLFFRSAARKTFSPQPVPRGFLDRAFIPLMFRPTTFHANARDFAAMRAAVERQSRRYHEIAVPLTVIAGDGDEIVWTDLHSRSLVREVPGAELVVLPGVGHMPHYARPDVVLPAIDAMAARIRPAEAPSP